MEFGLVALWRKPQVRRPVAWVQPGLWGQEKLGDLGATTGDFSGMCGDF